MTTIRPYDQKRDFDACCRIWRETGWIEDNQKQREALRRFIHSGRAMVGELDGEAECLVLTAAATLAHLQEDLPMVAVTSVTTSHIARKQGLAGRMTAQAIARAVAEGGAVVAGLGMFEQGYYDRLGFGVMPYDHIVKLTPRHLCVPNATRAPKRLSVDDWNAMHYSFEHRLRHHGMLRTLPADKIRAELEYLQEKSFGLGFFDGPDGKLTHHLWIHNDGHPEYGPYQVEHLCFQNRPQFLELLGVLRNLGDQVDLISMVEPPGVQMQDLMDAPFHMQRISERSDYATRITARAWGQLRVCDVPACVRRVRLPRVDPPVRFNLTLEDPIERFLPEEAPWRGVSGTYTVSLGTESMAESGRDESLPTLECGTGAFSRLWIGARRASSLSMTDALRGPEELLRALDEALRLPEPHYGWVF